MSISSSVLPCDGAMPELDEASIRPTRDPPPGRAGDWADAALLLAQDRDRIAAGMNDLVVHRLFAAGLALETALGLMGGHPGAGKVHEAVGELDLAIRDVRNVVFDHHHPDSPPRRAVLALPAVLTRLTFPRAALPELSPVPRTWALHAMLAARPRTSRCSACTPTSRRTSLTAPRTQVPRSAVKKTPGSCQLRLAEAEP
jgi:hypothetical protein